VSLTGASAASAGGDGAEPPAEAPTWPASTRS
jgi:hypothetical protein